MAVVNSNGKTHTMAATKSTRSVIRFEYCECGCGHYNLSLGTQNFSSQRNGREKPSYSLFYSHHGRGSHIGTFTSLKERDTKLREVALPILKEELAMLTEQHEALVALGA